MKQKLVKGVRKVLPSGAVRTISFLNLTNRPRRQYFSNPFNQLLFHIFILTPNMRNPRFLVGGSREMEWNYLESISSSRISLPNRIARREPLSHSLCASRKYASCATYHSLRAAKHTASTGRGDLNALSRQSRRWSAAFFKERALGL